MGFGFWVLGFGSRMSENIGRGFRAYCSDTAAAEDSDSDDAVELAAAITSRFKVLGVWGLGLMV